MLRVFTKCFVWSDNFWESLCTSKTLGISSTTLDLEETTKYDMGILFESQNRYISSCDTGCFITLRTWQLSCFSVFIRILIFFRFLVMKTYNCDQIPYRTKFRRKKLPKIWLAAKNVRRKVLSSEYFVRWSLKNVKLIQISC